MPTPLVHQITDAKHHNAQKIGQGNDAHTNTRTSIALFSPYLAPVRHKNHISLHAPTKLFLVSTFCWFWRIRQTLQPDKVTYTNNPANFKNLQHNHLHHKNRLALPSSTATLKHQDHHHILHTNTSTFIRTTPHYKPYTLSLHQDIY